MLRAVIAAAFAAVGVAASAASESPPQPVTTPDFSNVHSFEPAWSPDGTRLAVQRIVYPQQLPRPQIVVMNGDRSAPHRIGTGFYPTWSPDGTRLAVQRIVYPQQLPRPQIVVMNGDRSAPHRIGTGFYPTWSPDGREVAFIDAVVKPLSLTIAAANAATSMRVVPVGIEGLERPAWSPDGRWIAFRTRAGISVIQPDGHGLRTLIPGGAGPDWSPDGQRIVFEANERLEVANADGSGRRPLGEVPHGAAKPRWSPDRRLIAFTVGTPLVDAAIYVMDSDGTDVRRLTPPGFDDPSWAPDSRSLATSSWPGSDWSKGDVSIVPLDGSPSVRFLYGGCTLVGTEGPDTLTGRTGDDVICGFGGDDAIDGGTGDDRILGGGGDDQIHGGPGRDTILGEDGADVLDGGAGRDSIAGGAGADAVPARDGEPDFVDGGDGTDTATADRRDCLILVERGEGGVRGCTGTATFTITRDPAWSPEGKKIAFVDQRGTLGSLYVMNGDGSARHRVIKGWFDASWPSWSPDGHRIAFEHGHGTSSRPNGIYTVGVDGTGLRYVTRGGEPDWSPGGKLIAFAAPWRLGNEVVSVVSPSGRGERVIANPRDECELYTEPTWSPDGEIVAFTASGAGGECGYSLFIGGTRGSGGLGRVVAGGYYAEPDWSPDGGKIALMDYGKGSYTVGVFDRGTHRVRYLRDGTHPRWSPDGREIVFVRGDPFAKHPRTQIYVMDADGSHLRRLTP